MHVVRFEDIFHVEMAIVATSIYKLFNIAL